MGYILKVELTELADGLDVECEQKESVKDKSQVVAKAPW